MPASVKEFFHDQKEYLKSFWSVENRTTSIALGMVVIAGTLLRVHYLWHTITYDEQLTNIIASRPLVDVLTKLDIPNNHILHSFFMNLSIRVFGGGAWALRLPALIAGILMIPAAYFFACIFYDRTAALLAAALVATSSVLVEYSVLARGYTILLLIFLLLLTLAAYQLRTNNSFAWILFSVLAALGFLTIPVMYYPFGVIMVWLLFSIALGDSTVSKGALFKKYVLSAALTGVLTLLSYLPVFLNGSYKESLAIPELDKLSWSKFFPEAGRTARLTWQLWTRDVNVLMIAVLVAGFVVSLVFYRKTTDYRVPLVVAAIVWVVPLLLVLRIVTTSRVRDWLFLLLLFLVLAGAGIGFVLNSITDSPRKRAVIVPVCALLLALVMGVNVLAAGGITRSDQGGACHGAEEITLFLKDYLKPGDRLLSFCPCDLVLGYYFERHGLPREHTRENLLQGDRVVVVVNTDPIYKQTVASVLAYGNIDYRAARDRLTLVKRYRHADIYALPLH